MLHCLQTIISNVSVLILGHGCCLAVAVVMLCLVAWLGLRDALKVVLFYPVFRACLEPVGRPLWREGKIGGGKVRGEERWKEK